MRRGLAILISVAALTAASLVGAGASAAEDVVVECPDHYVPAPTGAASDKDKNDNAWVCVKAPNQNDPTHINETDDKGFVVDDLG